MGVQKLMGFLKREVVKIGGYVLDFMGIFIEFVQLTIFQFVLGV